MKFLIKYFVSILLFPFIAAFASSSKPVELSCCYLQMGVGPLPLPVPNFGVGYRCQHGHHGYDLSLQVATVVSITGVKGNALYHYYFKPNLNSQFYVGGGIGAGYLFVQAHNSAHTALISPELVFGKTYLNKNNARRFVQAQVSFPTYEWDHSPHCFVLIPLVVFSYGIGF